MQLGYPYPKRKEHLSQLAPVRTNRTFDVPFQGSLATYSVHKVPLELPKYRLNNGRTLAAQAEYLALHPETQKDFFTRDLESDAAQKTQHELLRDMVREKDLLGYFKKHKQEEPLILSADGFVVNGNRRLCAMRELYNEDKKAFPHFEHIDVIVLPPADDRDIDALEAQLQIHRDIKADYSWSAQAFMLKKRKEEHKYTNEDLARLYDMKDSEINELIEMLGYADAYLGTRGKAGQYHLIEDTKYAFQQLRKTRSSKAIKSEAERNIFEQVAYCLIDKPEDGRLYESIPAVGRYMPRVLDALKAELPLKKAERKGGHELLGGGEGGDLVEVAEAVERTENLEKLRAIVSEVVAAESAKEKERKRGDFVLWQVRKANSALVDAANGITEDTEQSGVAAQLQSIEKSIALLRKWLNGKH
jgi:hypothetical protein